jgi:hypothetical protein
MSGKAKMVEITVVGTLDSTWSEWLHGMEMEGKEGSTILRGLVADQAALRGLLSKIWDLNLSLISFKTYAIDSQLEEGS